MATGTVKWFNGQKGYGFIVPDQIHPAERDVFVHITALNNSQIGHLNEGQRVQFDLDRRFNKEMAVNLRIVE